MSSNSFPPASDLPPRWSRLTDPHGRPYFHDSVTNTTSWHPPSQTPPRPPPPEPALVQHPSHHASPAPPGLNNDSFHAHPPHPAHSSQDQIFSATYPVQSGPPADRPYAPAANYIPPSAATQPSTSHDALPNPMPSENRPPSSSQDGTQNNLTYSQPPGKPAPPAEGPIPTPAIAPPSSSGPFSHAPPTGVHTSTASALHPLPSPSPSPSHMSQVHASHTRPPASAYDMTQVPSSSAYPPPPQGGQSHFPPGAYSQRPPDLHAARPPDRPAIPPPTGAPPTSAYPGNGQYPGSSQALHSSHGLPTSGESTILTSGPGFSHSTSPGIAPHYDHASLPYGESGHPPSHGIASAAGGQDPLQYGGQGLTHHGGHGPPHHGNHGHPRPGVHTQPHNVNSLPPPDPYGPSRPDAYGHVPHGDFGSVPLRRYGSAPPGTNVSSPLSAYGQIAPSAYGAPLSGGPGPPLGGNNPSKPGGYGAPPPTSHGFAHVGGYAAPPPNNHGSQHPSMYVAPQQGPYGPPQAGDYGPPQPGTYGVAQPGSHGPPHSGGYGVPPPSGHGSQQPSSYGAAPHGGHGPPQPGGYGIPQQSGYGAPQPGGYGTPQPGGYGASQPSGYGASQPSGYGAQQSGAYGHAPPTSHGPPQSGGHPSHSPSYAENMSLPLPSHGPPPYGSNGPAAHDTGHPTSSGMHVSSSINSYGALPYGSDGPTHASNGYQNPYGPGVHTGSKPPYAEGPSSALGGGPLQPPVSSSAVPFSDHTTQSHEIHPAHPSEGYMASQPVGYAPPLTGAPSHLPPSPENSNPPPQGYPSSATGDTSTLQGGSGSPTSSTYSHPFLPQTQQLASGGGSLADLGTEQPSVVHGESQVPSQEDQLFHTLTPADSGLGTLSETFSHVSISPGSDPKLQSVKLEFQATGLRDKDIVGKSDPILHVFQEIQVKVEKKIVKTWQLVGSTEKVENSTSPSWVQRVEMIYYFERRQPLRFEIVDIDDQKTGKGDELGYATSTLAEVVSNGNLKLPLHTKKGTARCGELLVRAHDNKRGKKVRLHLSLSGKKLDKKDVLGKSDPYYIIRTGKASKDGGSILYKSEYVKQDCNPCWQPHMLELSSEETWSGIQLCISVFDWDKNSEHDFIGEATFSLEQLCSSKSFSLIGNEKRRMRKGNRTHISGELVVNQAAVVEVPSLVEYLQGGLQVEFIVAVDLTASNRQPDHPKSLHFMGDPRQPSQYYQALHAVGTVLTEYSSDGNVTALGFGAKLPGCKETAFDFALTGQADARVSGVNGLLQAYIMALENAKLDGPTYFAPIIRNAMQVAARNPVSQTNQHFAILLILTDGVITDQSATVDLIIEASYHTPLAIVIVGIGDANFAAMQRIDSDGRKLMNDDGSKAAKHDIVQFAEFNSSKPIDEFAAEILHEVPDRIVEFMLDGGIKPNPPT